MNEKEDMQVIANKVAELLPHDIIVDVVGKVIGNAISHLAYSSESIGRIVQAAVEERARELLKTKYAVEVDKQADLLAAQLVSTLGRMRMPERW